MLELKGIHKYYNPGTVNEMCLFQNFNLTIDKGEFVSVVGSNGSGKTSMLNIICGSIPVEGGQILINGSDITKQKEFKRNQRIGRVYQNPAMGTCPSMTILENMSLADNKGKVFGLSRGTNKARIEYYREQLSQLGLGLEDKMDVKVGALSGGQRQAMALLMSTMTPLDGVKLVICAPEVPCGKLTQTLTEKLGVTLSPVSEEQAVTDVRGKVSSGQADAGIVYKSDALAEGDAVDTVDIQGADEAVNEYPIALVSTSTKKDYGQKWIDLVLSEEGQALLSEAGFTPAVK